MPADRSCVPETLHDISRLLLPTSAFAPVRPAGGQLRRSPHLPRQLFLEQRASMASIPLRRPGCLSVNLKFQMSRCSQSDYAFIFTRGWNAEGRGHEEFRRRWEVRSQTEKRHAGALKTHSGSQIQEGKAVSVKIKKKNDMFTSSVPQINTCTAVEALWVPVRGAFQGPRWFTGL